MFRFLLPQIKEGMRICSKLDVPFVGDAWDQPITSYENTIVFYLARFLSRKLNAAFGFDTKDRTPDKFRFNLRPMAAYSSILFVAFCFFVVYFFVWLLS